VKYRTVDGVELLLDVYTPKDKGNGPFPAVMYVHGGGWTGGDKSGGAGMTETPELLSRGFVVIAINYRLAPKYTVPSQVEDVKYAIRYVKSNSRELNIDAERLGLIGGSAGGHLVSLMGVTGPEDGLEGDFDLPVKSSRVRAVVDMFGPADLDGIPEGKAKGTVAQAFGVNVDDPGARELLRKYSPVTYATADDPPFLILHGDKDEVVPLDQSQRLYRALQKSGVDSTLLVVKNAGHGLNAVGGTVTPARAEVSKAIAVFFERTLK
jgi:acetyl esterase/lipase